MKSTPISSAARNLVFPSLPPKALSFRRRRKLRSRATGISTTKYDSRALKFQFTGGAVHSQLPTDFGRAVPFSLLASCFSVDGLFPDTRQLTPNTCIKYKVPRYSLGMTTYVWGVKRNTRFLAMLEIPEAIIGFN